MPTKYDHENEIVSSPLMMGYSSSYVSLTNHRVLFISEGISDGMAAELSALLLFFDQEDPDEMIELYIHTDGGSGSALINIYDVIQMISAPVKTICIGKCYSAGAFLLAAGTRGERYAFKNSSIMIHGIQALFPIPGHDITENKNYLKFLQESNDSIMQILADHTGHSLEKIKKDCEEDVWLSAEEALDYGIIDYIL